MYAERAIIKCGDGTDERRGLLLLLFHQGHRGDRRRKKRGSCKKVKQTGAVGGPWEGEGEEAGEDFFCDHPSVSPVSTRVASPLLYTPSFSAKFAKAGINRGVIAASKQMRRRRMTRHKPSNNCRGIFLDSATIITWHNGEFCADFDIGRFGLARYFLLSPRLEGLPLLLPKIN